MKRKTSISLSETVLGDVRLVAKAFNLSLASVIEAAANIGIEKLEMECSTGGEEIRVRVSSAMKDDLAQTMGLNRDAMRALRRTHLTEGTTWHRKEKRLWITSEGEALIHAALGVVAPIAPEKKEGPRENELTVTRIPSRNLRIVEAQKKDGRAVRVRVTSNVNFIPGMVIYAREEGPYEDVMTLEGRCPRYRGRW